MHEVVDAIRPRDSAAMAAARQAPARLTGPAGSLGALVVDAGVGGRDSGRRRTATFDPAVVAQE
jgi:hypothetical protein